MKKNLLIAFLLGLVVAGTAIAADPERFVALVRGSYGQTTSISVGTGGDVSLVAADAKRVDLSCRNNSAFVIWIGTDSAGATLSTFGMPVLSSETFKLDAFTDTVFAIATGGTADVRCWEGKFR